MIVDSAVLVVDKEQRSTFPKLLVLSNGVVDGSYEDFACLHVVVGMLVGCHFLAVVAVVVRVVRLNEGVLGQIPAVAIRQKLIVGPKCLGLILNQVDNLQ